MSQPLLTVTVKYEKDVVAARQRARQLAMLLGFENQDQSRIATAVSEIARNAFSYAGGGKVEFSLEGRTSPQLLVIRISDQGPGIRDLAAILEGRYRSTTGMGLGLVGSKRLMDSSDILTSPTGTTVVLRKLLGSRSKFVGPDQLGKVVASLAAHRPDDPFVEVRQQNQELLGTLDEIRKRQSELERLNRELEDTNRGVVALYAELEERADHLRQADEVKTRFLSNMTHEFRTPVNSILALSALLIERADGELTPEQDRQVGYIRKSAMDLSELINDLLDLAKAQAGKTTVRTTDFEVASLFGALRGVLKPLLINQSVSLIFEEPGDIPPMDTDESKVSQILRNFISNALKFTERGQITVSARYDAVHDEIAFSVADTGIGIAERDLGRIFEEFSQLDSPIQRRVKGTGLGLPLAKRLSELLGGSLTVSSAPGAGSTFTVTLPRLFSSAGAVPETPVEVPVIASGLLPILAIEDRPEDRLVYDRMLRGSKFQLINAGNLREARDVLRNIQPRAILLDLVLGDQDAWKFLADLKADEATAQIPVLIMTSIDDKAKAQSLGADAYGVKPLERSWLVGELQRLVFRRTALVVDDDEASRYALRQMLRRAGWEAMEATNGADGLSYAMSSPLGAIFLDMSMPQMSGIEVLKRLRQHPASAATPVFISSASAISGEDDVLLRTLEATLMPKGELSPAGVAAALRAIEAMETRPECSADQTAEPDASNRRAP